MFRLAKKHLKLVLCFQFFLFAAGAYAQNVSFEANIDRQRIVLGSAAQLTLTVEGKQNIAAFDLPPIDGLQIQYLGPSTSVSIVNGQVSQSVSHIYSVLPLKVGTFQIPAFSVTIDGQKISTQTINFEVVDSSSVPSSGGTQEPNASSSAGVSLKDKIFLVIETPRKEVYLQEKIPLTLRLYVHDLSVSVGDLPQINGTGFTKGEFKKSTQYKQTVGDKAFNIAEFNIDIFPNRTGALTVGPADLLCYIVQRYSEGGSPFGDFDSFFQGFFDRVEKQPLTVHSDPLEINVLPLPTQGKPEDYSDAVGAFVFDMTASPLEVNVGDPVTIRMKVSGEGDLNTVKFPSYKENDDFKVYEPQVKDEQGVKVIEQIIIPRNPDVKEIPTLEFNYFDSQKKDYVRVSKGPFAIKVNPGQGSQNLQVVDSNVPASLPSALPETLGRDIIYIKEKPGTIRPVGYRFSNTMMYKILYVLVTLIFAGIYFYLNRLRRLNEDHAYARKLKAPAVARAGLNSAGEALKKNDLKLFYDILYKTVQEYFGHKFHLTGYGMTYGELEKYLVKKKIPSTVLNRLKGLFNDCDEARFASAGDLNKAQNSFKTVEELIDYFEREVR